MFGFINFRFQSEMRSRTVTFSNSRVSRTNLCSKEWVKI